jgi:hypothetical protein
MSDPKGDGDCHILALSQATPFLSSIEENIFLSGSKRDLILVQHQYNNCTTTPHMRVDPSMWDLPSCEELLYSCCIGVVNLTFSVVKSD